MIVHKEWEHDSRFRIEKVRAGSIKMKRMLMNLTLPLKIGLIKCCIFPVLMYGAEEWTMREQERTICL